MAWNKPTEAKSSPPRKAALRRSQFRFYLFVGTVICTISVGTIFLIVPSSDDSGSVPSQSREKMSEVVPARILAHSGKEPLFEAEKSPVQTSNYLGRVEASVNMVHSALQIGTPTKTNELGTSAEKDVNGRVLVEPTDQLLAMAASVPENMPIPPLPITTESDDEFVKSLKTKIVIDPNDSEELKSLKNTILALRNDVKESGLAFSELLASHQDAANYNATLHDEIAAELKKIVADGDMEGARKYQKIMNIALQQMGVSPVQMPRGSGTQERNVQDDKIEEEDEEQ